MSGKRQRESMRLFPHSRPPFPYRQVAVEGPWKGEQLARSAVGGAAAKKVYTRWSGKCRRSDRRFKALN